MKYKLKIKLLVFTLFLAILTLFRGQLFRVFFSYKLIQSRAEIKIENDSLLKGAYQGTGSIEGSYKDGIIKATWKNKGQEGRMELRIEGDQLSGKWKKGLEEGRMSGKWNGSLIKGDISSTAVKADDTILKVYEFFKTICNFNESAASSIRYKLEKNLDLIKPLYEHFDQIQKLYIKEFKPATSFKKLVDFDFAWLIINNFSTSDFMDDIDIEDYENFEAYEPSDSAFAKSFLANNTMYFPSFNNDSFDDNYASYDLDQVRKSYENYKDEFEDIIDYVKYHVGFITLAYLRYGITDGIYVDACENEDSVEEFKIWAHKFSDQYDWEDHDIIDALDDSGNLVSTTIIQTIAALADEPISDEEGITLEEYCKEDTQDFSTIKYINANFYF